MFITVLSRGNTQTWKEENRHCPRYFPDVQHHRDDKSTTNIIRLISVDFDTHHDSDKSTTNIIRLVITDILPYRFIGSDSLGYTGISRIPDALTLCAACRLYTVHAADEQGRLTDPEHRFEKFESFPFHYSLNVNSDQTQPPWYSTKRRFTMS